MMKGQWYAVKDKRWLFLLASLISIAGHPLIVVALTTIWFSSQLYESRKSFIISVIVITFTVIPVVIHNYIKTKRNVYSNFDVSDRKERVSFYFFSITILLITTIILHFVSEAGSFLSGTFVALLMLISTAVVNKWVKASLHAAVIYYMAIACLGFNHTIGAALLIFGVFVGISRVVLQRHTLQEVVIGSIIGVAFGSSILVYSF